MGETPEYRFKMVIVGPWGVGKTSVVKNYIDQKFSIDYLPTIGANVLVKELNMEFRGEMVKVILSVWDIAGQETFESMRPSYYAGASGAFLVADLSRIQSFEKIVKWAEELKIQLPGIPSIFLTNKCDLEFFIDEDYIRETAERMNILATYKTSAVTGENVQTAFEMLARKMLDLVPEL